MDSFVNTLVYLVIHHPSTVNAIEGPTFHVHQYFSDLHVRVFGLSVRRCVYVCSLCQRLCACVYSHVRVRLHVRLRLHVRVRVRSLCACAWERAYACACVLVVCLWFCVREHSCARACVCHECIVGPKDAPRPGNLGKHMRRVTNSQHSQSW